MTRLASVREHSTGRVPPRSPAGTGWVALAARWLVGTLLLGGLALGCSAEPGGGPPRPVQSHCGNSSCEPSESCSSCAKDCGACSAQICGNDTCDEAESCADCGQECGSCPTSCGDGKCEASECDSCPADCGACPDVCGASCAVYCGDAVCVPGKESCSTCAADCGACATCGDGVCDATESCSSCAGDCCPNCGNGVCDEGERCDSCSADCGECVCGDDFCSPGESCLDDCASDVEICGNGKCDPGESCSECSEDCAPCVSYDPEKLVVYTVNYENLMGPVSSGDASCKGQWLELLDTIASRHIAPDVLVVQQINGKGVPGGIQVLQEQLMQRFPKETYKALVAEDEPTPWTGAPCPGQEKQTNGILFREKRLSLIAGSRKTRMAKQASGEACIESTESRNLGVFARFGDLMSAKTATGGRQREVAVASVHWPSDASCAETNAKETHEQLTADGEASVIVWGGGVDSPDHAAGTALPWYRLVNADLDAPDSLGYTDSVWASCDSEGFGPCLEENATFGTGRHDYPFFKLTGATEESGIGEVVTLDADPNENGLPYSRHRAISAEIFP